MGLLRPRTILHLLLTTISIFLAINPVSCSSDDCNSGGSICVNGDSNNATKSNNLNVTNEASDNVSKDQNDQLASDDSVLTENYTLTTDDDDDGTDTNGTQHTISSINEMSGSNAAVRGKEKRRKTFTWLWILLSLIILFLIAVTALLFCWKEKKPDGHEDKEAAGSSKAPPVPKDGSSTMPTSAKGSKEKPSPATSNQPDKAPLQPATKVPD